MRKLFLLFTLLFMVSCSMLSQQQPSIKFYNSNIYYQTNDLVSLDGIIYVAINPNNNDSPPSSNWGFPI